MIVDPFGHNTITQEIGMIVSGIESVLVQMDIAAAVLPDRLISLLFVLQ
jgi:hypothetical protein